MRELFHELPSSGTCGNDRRLRELADEPGGGGFFISTPWRTMRGTPKGQVPTSILGPWPSWFFSM